jgi:hypothetical protein
MDQNRIYKPGSEILKALLDEANGAQGATLLIPDLQRPYRWSPDQVVRLMDSLMRGWPFGTLLLWQLDDSKVAEIPYRRFWRLVDRTTEGEGTQAAPLDPPSTKGYRMVLDGQQRLQSLIVALEGGDAGFKLEDREWWASLDPERAKGRAAKHWSRGVLCLDLPAFLARHGAVGGSVKHVDYTQVLKWVVCAAQGGRSDYKKPVNYEVPIPARTDEPGRFIQVSRLWAMAQVGTPSTGAVLKQIHAELAAQKVPEELVADAGGALLDLVLGLGKVKETEVSFLELLPIQRNNYDAAQYDDAVVNIFTRLNAGGRALSEEEITFAWIKRNWKLETPDSKQATPAFEALQEELAEAGVSLSMDKLVQAVSVLWAVVEREGRLLRPSDLLRGDQVGPLAAQVSERWSTLAGCLIDTATKLRELGALHGFHYESLNAFITLAAWRQVGVEWCRCTGAKLATRHNIATRLEALLAAHAKRFLVLTSWAGVWGASAGRFPQYATELAADFRNVCNGDADKLQEVLAARLEGWVAECLPKAAAHINDLQAGRREDVRHYYVPLWVWHQLDAARRDASKGLNIPKSRAKLQLDVDHIVSFASWERRLAAGEGPETWANDVNQLGNCFLLEKNFNISKSDKPLGEFLDQLCALSVPESRSQWMAGLALGAEMVDPTAVPVENLRSRILDRTKRIKADLVAFVQGEIGFAEEVEVEDVTGTWSTSVEEGGKPKEALMILRQDAAKITGTYGEGCVIDGTFQGAWLHGTWCEPGYTGRFAWQFTPDGRRFDGTWGMNKKPDGAGRWTGLRQGG